jgi:hypothetical protein
MNVTMLTPNYGTLLKLVKREICNSRFEIVTKGKPVSPHPISIIGVDKSGEKKLLSSDGASKDWSSHEELLQYKGGKLFYTSFYEINDRFVPSNEEYQ